jgi:hypothetical protein
MNDVYPKECFIFFAVHTPLSNLQSKIQDTTPWIWVLASWAVFSKQSLSRFSLSLFSLSLFSLKPVFSKPVFYAFPFLSIPNVSMAIRNKIRLSFYDTDNPGEWTPLSAYVIVE